MNRLFAYLVVAVFVLETQAYADIETETNTLIEARLFADAHEQLQDVGPTHPDYAVAQRLLGMMFADGTGTEKDLVAAATHFREAAGAGDVESMYQLGQAYEHGWGVAESGESAYHWYDRAAQEHIGAAVRYAEIALANRERSDLVVRHDPIERLEFAAEQGNLRAKYLLGQLVLNGQTEEIDQATAIGMMKEVSSEIPEAYTVLGKFAHLAGDTERAAEYFAKASEGGDREASAYLGRYAEYGELGVIDRKTAWDYYKQARGIGWAEDGLERLRRHSASIELMGLRIWGSTRKEVSTHFQRLGMDIVDSQPNWDTFDANGLAGEREGIVSVAYAPDSPRYVAEVTYRFPSKDRRVVRETYRELETALREKYGIAERGRDSAGERFMTWAVDDVVIHLSMPRKEMTAVATYQLVPFIGQLRAYLDETQHRRGLRDAL